MVLVLYGNELSPPVRAVLLTLRELQLEHEFRNVDLMAGEHLLPDFVRKNPQHTVPLLQDDESYIADSHAIIGYLVNKYAQQDTLYPQEPIQRAAVDQRLHYESSVLFNNLKQLNLLLFKQNVTELPKDKLAELYDSYALLEKFLELTTYLAGEHLTIADFSTVATVSTLNLTYAPLDADKYPKLCAWLARLEALPYYEQANLQGARLLADKVRAKLPKQFDKLWQKAFADIKSGAGKQ
ncbi:GstE10 [Drosophila busckii]|uniref:GstE10 n=1 Tax=Drosophila busckii TaxID=30019 RepID=A0A0M4EG15_DROBS|nr:glutathione S-transferase 1 [Drosophila busckii]ALC42401.1 GstE10 [Drosophila busckii]